jgi:hypothetical protein
LTLKLAPVSWKTGLPIGVVVSVAIEQTPDSEFLGKGHTWKVGDTDKVAGRRRIVARPALASMKLRGIGDLHEENCGKPDK